MNVVTSNNQFAGDLYRELAKETGTGESNIFFSPFSISSALALTYEGAGGTTADEIRSVFHFPANNTSRREGFAADKRGDKQRGCGLYPEHGKRALGGEDLCLPSRYINIAQQYYNATTTNLDFAGQPEASRQTINNWVAGKTNNRIQNLLPAGSIDPMTGS